MRRRLGLLLGAAVAIFGVLVGVGRLLAAVSDSGFEMAERDVDADLVGARTPALNRVTAVLSAMGSTPVVVGVGLATAVLCFVLWRRWAEVRFLAAALVGEVTIFLGTTLSVDRQRPAVPHLDMAPPTSSFPSGHTAASTVLYGGLALLVATHTRRTPWRVLAWTFAVLVPVAVAVARLYRGMHYPTDVLAGATFGLVWLLVVAKVVRPR